MLSVAIDAFDLNPAVELHIVYPPPTVGVGYFEATTALGLSLLSDFYLVAIVVADQA